MVGSAEEKGAAGVQVTVLCAGCVDLELQLLSNKTDKDGGTYITGWTTTLLYRVTNNGPVDTQDATIRLGASIGGVDKDNRRSSYRDNELNWERVDVFGHDVVRALGTIPSGENTEVALQLFYMTPDDKKAEVSWRASVEMEEWVDPVANDTLGGFESHANSSGCFLDILGYGSR